MHAIISQRDFRQLEHITSDGPRSKQLSGSLPACYLHQLADLFYQASSPIRVCEPSRSKGYTLPDKVSADDMKAQEAHRYVGKSQEQSFGVAEGCGKQ